MFKKILFQTHWLLGITAGVVLAIVGVTGAALSFEHELLRVLNPGVMTVSPNGQAPLTPAELIARVQTTHPERRITALNLSGDPEHAARITFAARPGSANRRGESHYLNPYSGELHAKPRGEAFFRQVTQIHRYLAAGDTGKAIVGASTVALLVLCLSGVYLRWPRRPLRWRAWLTLNWSLRGRGFLWSLHAVAGTWALAFYILASLTGLYWSYDWYRDGLFALTGAPRTTQQAPQQTPQQTPPPQARANSEAGERTLSTANAGSGGQTRSRANVVAPTPDLARAWMVFRGEVKEASSVTIRLPERAGQTLQFNYLDLNATHERASNRLVLDASGASIINHERYDDKPAGAKLMSSMFVLHSGAFFGLPGLILMMLASLMMPLFAISGWMLYLDRRRKKSSRILRPAAESA